MRSILMRLMAKNEPINALRIAMKILAKKAVQNPASTKPLTSSATSIKTNALITNRNNPMLNSVSGRVNKMSKGRTIAFARPNTKAEIIKAPESLNWRPSKT